MEDEIPRHQVQRYNRHWQKETYADRVQAT